MEVLLQRPLSCNILSSDLRAVLDDESDSRCDNECETYQRICRKWGIKINLLIQKEIRDCIQTSQLNLSNSYCGRKNVTAALIAIRKVPGIETINLSGCGINSATIEGIVPLLADHVNLTTFIVKDNDIHRSALRHLSKLARLNVSVTEIDFSRMIFSSLSDLFLFQEIDFLCFHNSKVKLRDEAMRKQQSPDHCIVSDHLLCPILGNYFPYVLQEDGLISNNLNRSDVSHLTGLLVPLYMGISFVMRELDILQGRIEDLSKCRSRYPLLSSHIACFKKQFLQSGRDEPTIITNNELCKVYIHIKRIISSVLRNQSTEADGNVKHIEECILKWIEDDRKSSRTLPELSSLITYCLMNIGTQGADVMRKWHCINRERHGMRFSRELNNACIQSDFSGLEKTTRGELVEKIKSIFPPVVVDYLLHVSLLSVQSPNCFEQLRLFPSCNVADLTLPSEDLPFSLPQSDFLLQTLNWLSVRSSSGFLVKDFTCWLQLQPVENINSYATYFPPRPKEPNDVIPLPRSLM